MSNYTLFFDKGGLWEDLIALQKQYYKAIAKMYDITQNHLYCNMQCNGFFSILKKYCLVANTKQGRLSSGIWGLLAYLRPG